MNDTLKIIIKSAKELSQKEIDSINVSKAREWKIPPMKLEQLEKSTFFLIKDQNNEINAFGQLIEINDVIFNNQTFNILGIGGIIANQKGKGFGRVVMESIKEYLKQTHKSGVGFTDIPDFYHKCGFLSDKAVIKRFIHLNNNSEITNINDACVLYFDSEDRFMEKVLTNPGQKVYLPREPDW